MSFACVRWEWHESEIRIMRNVLGKSVASVENEMGHGEGHGTVLQYDMKHGNT